MKKKNTKGPVKIEVPFDIALSLTRPDELEKLRKHVTYYFTKHPDELGKLKKCVT
jgi:hypothetical protein